MAEKLLGLILELDRETEARMKSIELALRELGIRGEQTADVPHHITLGMYPLSRERELTERIERAREKLKGFPITFQHIGLFGLRVLFFAPDASRELLDLHALLALEPDPRWCPHATLLMDRPENILKALPVMAERFERLDARAARLYLSEFPPERTILSIDL